jgi:RNA polymerase sigma-70 factor (ECF subfamily)
VNHLETRLAKLARNGDREAFETLVDLYQDKIYYFALRMLGNAQEAEDVVQETFLRVYTNLDRYDETHKFSTWIYRIANNLCIDRLRRRKPTLSLDFEDENGDTTGAGYAVLSSEEDRPEEQMILSELQTTVRDAIEKLPDKYKSVVVLRYLHDLSLQEIGEVLDLPVTTVKTRVHRAREALRLKLEGKHLI